VLRLRPCRGSGPADLSNGKLRFDIHDNDLAIGKLVYDRQQSRGAFNIGEDGFVVERAGRGPELPARDPPATQEAFSSIFSLTNAAGALLARAERELEVYVVGREGESYILQPSRSRLYLHLQREGDVVNLGGVGQRKFWTSSLEMNLPDGFGAAFQVFLASLLLDRITQPSGRRPSWARPSATAGAPLA